MEQFNILKNLYEISERMNKMNQTSSEEILTKLNEHSIPVTKEMILEQYDQYMAIFAVFDYFYNKYHSEFETLDNLHQEFNSDYFLTAIMKIVKKERKNLLDRDPHYILNMINGISPSEPPRKQLKKFLPCMKNLTEAGKRLNEKDLEHRYNLCILEILTNLLDTLRKQRLSNSELKEVEEVMDDYIKWVELEEDDKMDAQLALLSCYAVNGYSTLVEKKKAELFDRYPSNHLLILHAIFIGLTISRKNVDMIRKEVVQIKPKNEDEQEIYDFIMNE